MPPEILNPESVKVGTLNPKTFESECFVVLRCSLESGYLSDCDLFKMADCGSLAIIILVIESMESQS